MSDTAELELAPVQPGEPPQKQIQPFDHFKAELQKLKATAETLTVITIDDRAGMKLARATRLTLKELRVAITHRHKELKADILKEGNKLDSDKRDLLAVIEPLETRMLECEEFSEREKVRIEDEKRTVRAAELTPFLSGPCAVDLGKMADLDYAGLLADARGAHQARIDAAAKAESDRIADEKAAAEERERVRLENERLKAEAAEREAAALKEREEAAAALKAEQERNAAALKAERERMEAEAAEERRLAAIKAAELEEMARVEREAVAAERKKAAEAAEKENARLAGIAEAERQKAATAARIAREEKEKSDAIIAEIKRKGEEAHAKADAEYAAEIARIEAAALAPDKEKLVALAAAVRALPVPELTTEKAVELRAQIVEQVEKFAAWIEKKGAAL